MSLYKSSAAKYNKPDGKIFLTNEPVSDGMFEIKVSDTGVGIPREELDSIFEPFKRVKSSQNLSEGTGVGLTITKRLIEAMNGNIKVRSTLGKGSCFTISLPNGEPIKHSKKASERSV